MDSEMTKAWRAGDVDKLAALGCSVGGMSGLGSHHKLPSDDKPETKEPTLVTGGVSLRDGKVTFTIPAVTASEANESAWVRKMKRKLSAKEAVRRTVGPFAAYLAFFAEAYHDGKALSVVFTRLGGRRLDQCNLPSSMKSVEDMIEGALLANDGDPRWRVRYEQEPGGEVGVRVEISVFE